MLKKISKKLEDNTFNIILLALFTLNALPLIAPVFVKLGWELPANIIYTVYSFFCHQFHWRSIHFFDHQVAWCTRDTSIWGGMLLSALATRIYKVKPIKIYWLILFLVPIALDGGIQTIATVFGFVGNDPLYMSTNFLRMLTGGFFGIGLGFWMLPHISEISEVQDSKKRTKDTRKEIPVTQAIVGACLILFTTYCILVFAWKSTSESYPPKNILDFAVKTPHEAEEWFVRRKNSE